VTDDNTITNFVTLVFVLNSNVTPCIALQRNVYWHRFYFTIQTWRTYFNCAA